MFSNWSTVGLIIILICFYLSNLPSSNQITHCNLVIDVNTNNMVLMSEDGDKLLEATVADGTDLTSSYSDCSKDDEICYEWADKIKIKIQHNKDNQVESYNVVWQALSPGLTPMDCFDTTEAHWYGGPELYAQQWPIENQAMAMQPYVSDDFVTRPQAFGSVIERYWMSSTGVGIRVDEHVPLHYGINGTKLCIKADHSDSVYHNMASGYPTLNYTIYKAENMVRTHHYMQERHTMKPTGIPDERMFRSPVWSTWARYKIHINQSVILQFAQEINEHGFSNSQIEIDDIYTINYGDFVFDKKRFPEPKKMLDTLHSMGFRVTTWIQPFANTDSAAFQDGLKHGYWVTDRSGNVPGLVKWWQGIGGMVDCTNPQAVTWWVERLKKMQALGIDSFKFDAGETCYLPSGFTTNQNLVNPSFFTTAYVNMVSEFGNLIEVRAAYMSQDKPIFVRIMDKDSVWGYNNGLKTLIPTMFQLSLAGYPFVLPDMIGGNMYNVSLPDRELYIRWTALNVFLPSMQFSISPWQYDNETVQIIKSLVELHENYVTPVILKLAEDASITGHPIIRPLWWIAPNDPICLTIDSEFLVGDDLLVAPVLEHGATSRDVYLPPGQWRDMVHGTNHAGGQWVKEVSVKLDEITYYERQSQ